MGSPRRWPVSQRSCTDPTTAETRSRWHQPGGLEFLSQREIELESVAAPSDVGAVVERILFRELETEAKARAP